MLAGQNTYFHNKTIMYFSNMNNIHIIHVIKYLQNIKYYTSCLYSKLIFCTQMVQGKFPFLYQFSFKESRDLGKTMFYIHTEI